MSFGIQRRKLFVVECKRCRRDVPAGVPEFPFQSIVVVCPRRQLTVRITHKPLKVPEARTRIVDPYRLWYTGGGLYLVVYDHGKSAIRTFAVERISSVSTTNQRFDIQEGFDFEAFQRTAFPVHGGEPQLVRIRFSPDQAPYIMERHWHDSQKFYPQDDGSIVMELQVGNTWEVKRWLIGWGADAELFSPSELREEMKRSAQETFAQYTGREVSA